MPGEEEEETTKKRKKTTKTMKKTRKTKKKQRKKTRRRRKRRDKNVFCAQEEVVLHLKIRQKGLELVGFIYRSDGAIVLGYYSTGVLTIFCALHF